MAHFAAPFQRIAADIAWPAASRPAAVRTGSPITSSSAGMTAAIVAGVSP